jgi:hypothetical protein
MEGAGRPRSSGDATVIDAKPSKLEAYAIRFKRMGEGERWSEKGRACGMRGPFAVTA